MQFKKKLLALSCSLIAANAAMAQEFTKLAHSSGLNVDIKAEVEGDGWCSNEPHIVVEALANNQLSEETLSALIAKFGSVIEKKCEEANGSVKVSHLSKDGEVLLSGSTSKKIDWVFVKDETKKLASSGNDKNAFEFKPKPLDYFTYLNLASNRDYKYTMENPLYVAGEETSSIYNYKTALELSNKSNRKDIYEKLKWGETVETYENPLVSSCVAKEMSFTKPPTISEWYNKDYYLSGKSVLNIYKDTTLNCVDYRLQTHLPDYVAFNSLDKKYGEVKINERELNRYLDAVTAWLEYKDVKPIDRPKNILWNISYKGVMLGDYANVNEPVFGGGEFYNPNRFPFVGLWDNRDFITEAFASNELEGWEFLSEEDRQYLANNQLEKREFAKSSLERFVEAVLIWEEIRLQTLIEKGEKGSKTEKENAEVNITSWAGVLLPYKPQGDDYFIHRGYVPFYKASESQALTYIKNNRDKLTYEDVIDIFNSVLLNKVPQMRHLKDTRLTYRLSFDVDFDKSYSDIFLTAFNTKAGAKEPRTNMLYLAKLTKLELLDILEKHLEGMSILSNKYASRNREKLEKKIFDESLEMVKILYSITPQKPPVEVKPPVSPVQFIVDAFKEYGAINFDTDLTLKSGVVPLNALFKKLVPKYMKDRSTTGEFDLKSFLIYLQKTEDEERKNAEYAFQAMVTAFSQNKVEETNEASDFSLFGDVAYEDMRTGRKFTTRKLNEMLTSEDIEEKEVAEFILQTQKSERLADIAETLGQEKKDD